MSVFGLPPSITYEQYVVLYLNRERVQAKRNFEQVLVGWAVTGQQGLPDEWLEAVATDDRELCRWHLWKLKQGL